MSRAQMSAEAHRLRSIAAHHGEPSVGVWLEVLPGRWANAWRLADKGRNPT